MNNEATPENRARSEFLFGTPVTLSDGQEWLLSDRVYPFGPIWDKIYDDNVIRGKYEEIPIQQAAFWLLIENYDLSLEEAIWLLVNVDGQILVPAVERNFFGDPDGYRTWTNYALTACYANGIDPYSIPAQFLSWVVDTLEYTGRMYPKNVFISSSEASAQKARNG